MERDLNVGSNVSKDHWFLDVLSDLEEFANENMFHSTVEYLADTRLIFLIETRQQKVTTQNQRQLERLPSVWSMNSSEKSDL